MKYSFDFPVELDLKKLTDQYWDYFGRNIKNNVLDTHVTNIGPVLSIATRDTEWAFEAIEDIIKARHDVVRIFVTKANQIMPIHRDVVSRERDIPRVWSLNIPLGHVCGWNEWFSREDNDFGDEQYIPEGNAWIPQESISPVGGEPYDPDFKVAETMILDRPKIFRTDVYHRAVNNSIYDRICLSIRYDPKITLNDIQELSAAYN